MYCVTNHYIHKVAGSLCHELLHFLSRPLLYSIHTTNTGYYFRISDHLKCMRKRGTLLLSEMSMDEVFCAYFIEFVVTVAKGILFCLLIGPG